MNEQNLKSFPPGKSGNPKGRPKGVENSSTRLLRLLKLKTKMKNPVTGKEENFTVLEQMDLALVNNARKGNAIAYKEILDRFEGKVKQGLELTGADGQPIKSENTTTILYIPEKRKETQSIIPHLNGNGLTHTNGTK